MTFEEFVAQYGDDFRYGLADGEVIGIAITHAKLPRCMPRTCLIRPFGEVAIARRPDTVVLDETALIEELR